MYTSLTILISDVIKAAFEPKMTVYINLIGNMNGRREWFCRPPSPFDVTVKYIKFLFFIIFAYNVGQILSLFPR